MINLLRADLFRLRKSKTFKSSIIIAGVLVAVFLFLSLDEEFLLSITTTFRNDRIYGFCIGKVKENANYLSIFRASLGLVIFSAITMIFLVTDGVISRYSNGVLKNTISYGHSKYKVYLSNLVSNFVGVSIITILYMGLFIIGAVFLFKPDQFISEDQLYLMITITLVVLVVLGAMVSIYTLISVIIKSKVVIATGAALFMTFISAALFDVIGKATQNKIPIYMLMDICGQPELSPLLGTFLINSFIIIGVSTVLGCTIFNKQEIK